MESGLSERFQVCLAPSRVPSPWALRSGKPVGSALLVLRCFAGPLLSGGEDLEEVETDLFPRAAPSWVRNPSFLSPCSKDFLTSVGTIHG